MRVAIIGDGTVGTALGKVLNIKPIGPGTSRIRNYDLIYICVPTPTHYTKGQDLSAVYDALSRIDPDEDDIMPYIVIRSTVLPGTCDKIAEELGLEDLIHMPEFGCEDTMLEDLMKPMCYIVGSHSLVASRFSLIPLPKAPVLFMSVKQAECVKYLSNIGNACRVAITNALYDWVGDDKTWKMAVEGAKLVSMPGEWGWEVNHKDGRGFGGKCFPKDFAAANIQNPQEVFDAILKYNYELTEGANWINEKTLSV